MLHRHASPAVAGSYLAGAVAGACVSASGLLVLGGLVSPIPGEIRNVVAIGLIVLLMLHTAGVLCLDLPQRKYQIPRETFGPSPARAAFRFSFELGTGMRTYITAASPYAIATLILLHSPNGLQDAAASAAAAAVGYGTGRSIVVVSQLLRRTIAVDHPKRWLHAADMVALATAFAVAARF